MHERHEHWTAAREQARIVAQEAFVPYFWSDLHGVRLQMLGSALGADDIQIVHEDDAKRSFLAEYRRQGELGSSSLSLIAGSEQPVKFVDFSTPAGGSHRELAV